MKGNKLNQIKQVLCESFRSPYYGFIRGHDHLSPREFKEVAQLVGQHETNTIRKYESEFAKLIGRGFSFAYAGARMAFFDIMRSQNVGKGDEVILLGATCAVMVNAVLRIGASPIFSDVDAETFGSSASSIEKCITSKTRMIVAQHSFGIPCNIESIVKLARNKKIFLLEDCALTLGSKVNGQMVGNFGDAAIFSTDHGKPINTLIGGLSYTNNDSLAEKLRNIQAYSQELSTCRQKALWHRLLFEANYCIPKKYGRVGLCDGISSFKKKLFNSQSEFLSDDFGSTFYTSYPYPARLPAFLAALGLMELQRWNIVSHERTLALDRLVKVVWNKTSGKYLPKAYFDKCLRIIPLRFAWSQPEGSEIRKKIQHFIQTDSTWFLLPIVASKEPLINLGYGRGVCPVSESIGPNMVNFPCNHNNKDMSNLINLIKTNLT